MEGNGMLVLTRRVGQKIIVGEGPKRVEITVARIHGDKVRLAVAAPRDVLVDREEVSLRRRRRLTTDG